MSLEELFASVLRVSVESLSNQSSPATLTSWNSQNHLRLIVTMEATYSVSFTSTEIHRLKSLEQARIMLRQKGVEA